LLLITLKKNPTVWIDGASQTVGSIFRLNHECLSTDNIVATSLAVNLGKPSVKNYQTYVSSVTVTTVVDRVVIIDTPVIYNLQK